MTQVKICGITNYDDAMTAVDAGANLLGFILWPKSPRYVALETVARIVERLPVNVRPVGVFVNASAEQMLHAQRTSGLTYVQLSGDEPPAVLDALGRRGYKALRAASVDEAEAEAEWYAPLAPSGTNAPELLLDTPKTGMYGGTGKTGNWQVAAQLARQYRILLAGGLNPDNVAEAIRQVQPWGIDVGSGVEAAPGRKDHEKVRLFIQAIKAMNDK